MGSIGQESNDRSCLGELVDPNVTIKPPTKLRSHVDELGLDRGWKKKQVLSIGDVKELWKRVISFNGSRKEGHKTLYLNELLMGGVINIPILEIPERNPELESRLRELKNRLDEEEYARMTRNVNSSAKTKGSKDDSIGYQMKQMNSALIGAVQFVISLAAAFLFGFSGIEVFVGELDLAVKLLLGIGSAVVVGIAELYVLVVLLDTNEAGYGDLNRKQDLQVNSIEALKKTQ